MDTILGQIGGLLDVAGADTSGGISLTASQGGKSMELLDAMIRHVKLPEGHQLLMASKCRFLLFERPFVCL